MRHSEIDKRAKRNAPRQCVADYGHNVHKDAPEPALVAGSFEPLGVTLERIMRKLKPIQHRD